MTLTPRVKKWLILVAVALFCLFAFFPFLIMIINTFKQDADLYRPQNNPFFYNFPPTLENLRLLFQRTNYLTFIKNSAIFFDMEMLLVPTDILTLCKQ